MQTFHGFIDNSRQSLLLPAQFFDELLPQIDNLPELKVTLYAIASITRSGDFANCILLEDFTTDAPFMTSLGQNPQEAQTTLLEALERAVQRGSLLKVDSKHSAEPRTYYFMNSPRGRTAALALQQGETSTAVSQRGAAHEKANIFQLYESNIGTLTPMMADTLRDAENTYPSEWIEEAMQLAVQNNIRRWSYIKAILKSWKEDGHHGANRRDSKEDYRRYVKGKFGQYGKH